MDVVASHATPEERRQGVPGGRVPRWQRWIVWAGRIISCAPVYIVLSSAQWKLTSNPWYVREWGRIGWAAPDLPLVASLQLVAIVLYVIPQTAVLGAVLLTGYMGGAIASYLRIGESYPPLVPLTTALLAWLGLYLREPRLRALLPFRRISRQRHEGVSV
jgi:hypothetical protein